MSAIHLSIERRVFRAVVVLAISVLVVLFFRLLKKTRPPSPLPVHAVPVEVLGDVRNPGIHLIEGEAPTVLEALKAAGGLKSGRKTELPGGTAQEKLGVGRSVCIREEGPGAVDVRVGSMEAAALLTVGGRIDINRAGEDDLLVVPRMKPEFARAIVDHRRQKAWKTVEELEEIPGVGRKTAEKWKDYLEVGIVK